MKTIKKVNVKDLSLDESYELLIRLKDMLTAKNDDQLMILPLSTLIRYCKAVITPNEAGFKLEKFIINQCGMRPISAKQKRGDCFMGWRERKYAEIKVSFEGKTSLYTIRNIRTWHDIDYYIICLISKKTLEPNFYVVELCDLLSEFRPSFMAGTLDENEENKNSNVGITIANNDENMGYLENINLMGGTTLEHLKFFNLYLDNFLQHGSSEDFRLENFQFAA